MTVKGSSQMENLVRFRLLPDVAKKQVNNGLNVKLFYLYRICDFPWYMLFTLYYIIYNIQVY